MYYITNIYALKTLADDIRNTTTDVRDVIDKTTRHRAGTHPTRQHPRSHRRHTHPPRQRLRQSPQARRLQPRSPPDTCPRPRQTRGTLTQSHTDHTRNRGAARRVPARLPSVPLLPSSRTRRHPSSRTHSPPRTATSSTSSTPRTTSSWSPTTVTLW